jgi:hypothetical protein
MDWGPLERRLNILENLLHDVLFQLSMTPLRAGRRRASVHGVGSASARDFREDWYAGQARRTGMGPGSTGRVD